MKLKKYYHCIVITNEERKFENDLMLSELHILSQLLKENKEVRITTAYANSDLYKLKFNK